MRSAGAALASAGIDLERDVLSLTLSDHPSESESVADLVMLGKACVDNGGHGACCEWTIVTDPQYAEVSCSFW